MAPGNQSSRKGRRNCSKDHGAGSLVLENSSSMLEGESASLAHQRSRMTRQTTSEMELIEIGKRENVSMFDVLIPPSKYQEILQNKDGTSTSEDEQSSAEESVHSGHDTDVHRYMARREMTPLQERINAITVIPGAFYCLLYLLSGAWLDPAIVAQASEANDMPMDDLLCVSSSWFPNLHALPPLPVAAAALGIIGHAPFSFIYHWSYAHRLPAGYARTNHWSRRMDQAMIHFCSASMSYATSGRRDFFFANLLFNADCFYRQFKKQVRPKRNQIRIAISVVAYTIPILRRGEYELFAMLWGVLSVSFLLFGLYPIGGWSHSAFHLVLFFVPPLLMNAAIDLPASQDQLRFAAQCAASAKQSLLQS